MGGENALVGITVAREPICDDIDAGRFMTLFGLLFNLETREVTWSSAGHESALLVRPRSNEIIELSGRDIPLGIDRDWHYQTSPPRAFFPGDVYVLATDGVWESRAAGGERFGKQRLREAALAHAAAAASQLCAELVDEVSRFRAGAPLHDDLTIVVVRVTDAA